jgi:anti-anti-sigma factor
MAYDITNEKKVITIEISGAFNALLAEELQAELEKINNKDIDHVIFDLEKTSTIASSGIRIIIFAEERLSKNGNVSIKNAKDIVLEVIKLSGIDDFVKIT